MKKVKEPKTYTFICVKCGKEFSLELTEKAFNKGKHRVNCSRNCACSHPHTEEYKQNSREYFKGKRTGKDNPNFGKRWDKSSEMYEKFRERVKKQGQAWSDEEKQRHSERMLGNSNWMRGKNHSTESKKNMSETRKQLYADGLINIRKINISKGEKEIAEWFKQNNIEFIQQFRVKGIRFIYDFYLPKLNLVIEYNGDFWHCNPKFYSSGQIVKRPKADSVLVDDIWEKDKLKKELIESSGHRLISIWESDYKANKEIILKQFIDEKN